MFTNVIFMCSVIYVPDSIVEFARLEGTCNFTFNGIEYALKPEDSVPWRKRTKEQSGCLKTFDGNTDPDSGHFGSATHAFVSLLYDCTPP